MIVLIRIAIGIILFLLFGIYGAIGWVLLITFVNVVTRAIYGVEIFYSKLLPRRYFSIFGQKVEPSWVEALWDSYGQFVKDFLFWALVILGTVGTAVFLLLSYLYPADF